MQNENAFMRKTSNEATKARIREQHEKQRFRMSNQQQHGNDYEEKSKKNEKKANTKKEEEVRIRLKVVAQMQLTMCNNDDQKTWKKDTTN